MRRALFLFAAAACAETLHYTAEWRGIEAGHVQLRWTARDAQLQIESYGWVGKLYHVKDSYAVQYDDNFCASSVQMDAEEGKKRLETKVAYARGQTNYIEKDLIRNETIAEHHVPIPACVHDIIAGIGRLRRESVRPGQTIRIPISDGRKFAEVQITGQEKETIRTPAGVFPTVRLEANLFNGVIYRRKARVFLWFTEDDRALPVQFRIQMPFLAGTVNLQLVKEGME